MSTKPALTTGAAIALAAASLFASACSKKDASSGDMGAKSSAMIHCMGVNACKGHGACKSDKNACAGQNGCKGQGFVEASAESCQQQGGTVMAAK